MRCDREILLSSASYGQGEVETCSIQSPDPLFDRYSCMAASAPNPHFETTTHPHDMPYSQYTQEVLLVIPGDSLHESRSVSGAACTFVQPTRRDKSLCAAFVTLTSPSHSDVIYALACPLECFFATQVAHKLSERHARYQNCLPTSTGLHIGLRHLLR